jgi:riboflavin synthase
VLDGILIGASVAVNGTCLTVVSLGEDGRSAAFDLIVETLRATNLGKLRVDGEVNYERSARVGDEIGGHTVSGHVHCTADIVEVVDTELNRKVVFQTSDVKLIKYVLPKGFIAVDGCSLTVGEVDKKLGRFNVWLIPETLRMTVLGSKAIGDTVNIEIESQTQVIVDTIERVLAERGL